MKDFYPVMVQSSQNNIDLGKADVRQFSNEAFIDVLFIDHKGRTFDQQLLTAVLNGRPIITSTDSKLNTKSNTIDIWTTFN